MKMQNIENAGGAATGGDTVQRRERPVTPEAAIQVPSTPLQFLTILTRIVSVDVSRCPSAKSETSFGMVSVKLL
jgi:hypothetical protein